MKKLIALLLALVMLAGLCACTNPAGGDKETTSPTTVPTEPSEPSEPSEPTDPSEPSQPGNSSGTGIGATGGFGERPQ